LRILCACREAKEDYCQEKEKFILFHAKKIKITLEDKEIFYF